VRNRLCFVRIGKGGIERLLMVATAREENGSETHTKYAQQEKGFRRAHVTKDNPVVGTVAIWQAKK